MQMLQPSIVGLTGDVHSSGDNPGLYFVGVYLGSDHRLRLLKTLIDFFNHNMKILTLYVGHEPLPNQELSLWPTNCRSLLFLGSFMWKKAYLKAFRREILLQPSHHEG